MSNRRLWSSSSRNLAVLLLAVVAPPSATLVWLGLRLLEQDRSLLAQREFERRQAAGQAATHSLDQSLASAERLLAEGPLPQGMLRLKVSSLGVEARPADRVLWLPVPRAMQAAETQPFADAEKLEFQGGAERALAAYQEMARSARPAMRAGALLRVARVHRRQGQWDDALRAYRSLAAMGEIAIEGMPADLLARRASCSVLDESGRTQELAREAAALEAGFLAGRWMLDRPAWELAAGEIERWTGHPLAVSDERKLFSAVANALWEEWKQARGEWLPTLTRRLVVAQEMPVTAILRTAGVEATALAISPSVLRAWTQQAVESGPAAGEQLTLLAASGQVLAGPALAADSPAAKLPASETGLPWTLAISSGDSSQLAAEFASRRRLLFAGLAAILLLLAGGSYFLWRVLQRELAVARLQTEFVSAVSHEFRTPLTSLRHVTELLEENDDMAPERRRSFYEALGRNTERLHHLVESLLDFARMEGGRKPYDPQPVDAGELAARVVADFQKEAAPHGFTIDLDVESPGAVPLRADSASLTNALWNLLDNAVKYSPDGHAVHVSVRRHPAGVAISVRDQGLGIPMNEQKEIFRRFVRGKKAGELGIKGTGLGLAMVSHIVEAHGGSIELESVEGAGSTFRLVFPAAPAARAEREPGESQDAREWELGPANGKKAG